MFNVVSLRAYQEDLKNLVFFREKEADESAVWGKALPDRLKVYRNNARTNWTDTLDCDFSLTRAQFEPAEWQALERRYFVTHPPQHWELNGSMAPFVQFLATQKVKAYVKELADYEWHDLKIFIDRAVVRKDLGTTNPTAVARVYQHQIFYWAEAGAPRERPPAQKPEVLLFYRDTRNTSHIRDADPLMLMMIEHFRKHGARLEDLEPVRQRLLPTSQVPLESVFESLQKDELLLL